MAPLLWSTEKGMQNSNPAMNQLIGLVKTHESLEATGTGSCLPNIFLFTKLEILSSLPQSKIWLCDEILTWGWQVAMGGLCSTFRLGPLILPHLACCLLYTDEHERNDLRSQVSVEDGKRQNGRSRGPRNVTQRAICLSTKTILDFI